MAIEPSSVEARPKNWLVVIILLSLRERPSYGYELMEQTMALGFEALSPSTLYRTLRRMEKDGVVSSRWETSREGAARRIYTITDAGEEYLNFCAEALEQYQRDLDTFFSIYAEKLAR